MLKPRTLSPSSSIVVIVQLIAVCSSAPLC